MNTYRNSTGGSSFKSHNPNPCPTCGWKNRATDKCECPKGYYCKLLRSCL